MDHPGVLVYSYNMHMILGTSVATHVSLLHTAIVVHIQDPFLEFHDVLARTHRLLWTLPLTIPWHEFKLRYDDFMVTRDPGANRERFYILGA